MIADTVVGNKMPARGICVWISRGWKSSNCARVWIKKGKMEMEKKRKREKRRRNLGYFNVFSIGGLLHNMVVHHRSHLFPSPFLFGFLFMILYHISGTHFLVYFYFLSISIPVRIPILNPIDYFISLIFFLPLYSSAYLTCISFVFFSMYVLIW